MKFYTDIAILMSGMNFINQCAEKYYFFLKKDINNIKFKNMRLI